MEDDSLFNAGAERFLTAEGIQELMPPLPMASPELGAVTGIQGTATPMVARSVMDSSEHVFFSGHGADRFCCRYGPRAG